MSGRSSPGPRVLIADPQPFFCESLASALSEEDGIGEVGWASRQTEAALSISAGQAQVVLAEVEAAGGFGLDLARRFGESVRLVVLTRAHEGDVLLEAVAAGATGCLSHGLDPSDLPALLLRATEGQFVVEQSRLHEVLKRASLSRTAARGGAASPLPLTPREREVLELLALGLDNEAIGRRLHLSTHTARTHVGNILRKLGVHSRADAARLALRKSRADGDTHVLRIVGPDLGIR